MNDIVQTWFPVVAWVCAIVGVGLALWFRVTARDEANQAVADLRAEITKELEEQKAAHAALNKSVIDHDRRLIGVEKGLEAFPTTRDIGKLSDQISQLAQRMEGLSATVSAGQQGQQRIETAIGIINEALMSKST